MLHLDRIWEENNRGLVLLVGGAIILTVALVDWWTEPYVSLGSLYLFPIIFMAIFLPRWCVVPVAALRAILTELFRFPGPSGYGLFAGELARNRRLMHGEMRLKALLETSPLRHDSGQPEFYRTG